MLFDVSSLYFVEYFHAALSPSRIKFSVGFDVCDKSAVIVVFESVQKFTILVIADLTVGILHEIVGFLSVLQSVLVAVVILKEFDKAFFLVLVEFGKQTESIAHTSRISQLNVIPLQYAQNILHVIHIQKQFSQNFGRQKVRAFIEVKVREIDFSLGKLLCVVDIGKSIEYALCYTLLTLSFPQFAVRIFS